MNYGVPYMGSKNKLVKKLAPSFPKAKHFYDLFAGGCAMMHYMMLDGRYEHLHANDINDTPRLFYNAINGKYKDEKRWISREDFFRLKDTDPYVRCCWSFGNNQRHYLYDRKIEPYKKALHYAVIFNEFSLLHKLCPEVAGACENALQEIEDTKQRRIEIGRAVVRWLKAYGTPEMVENNPLYKSCHRKQSLQSLQSLESLERLQSLERLESLQSLESLERLQSLERLERLQSLERLERLQSLERLERLQSLERLEVTQRDYRDIEFEENSVVYCDIPYKNTKKYNDKGFDHEAFYEWARQQKELVIISEYTMPEDFICITEIEHISTYSATNNAKKTVEKLFIPAHQKELYERMTR